jgi:hypothetical protein
MHRSIDSLPHNPSSVVANANDRSHIGNLYHKDHTNVPYVKHHTIILDSRDRRNGSTITKAIFDVYKAVNIKSPKAVMFVDSFIINDATAFGSCFYYIKIKEVAQPLSYYSGNKSMSDVVLINKGDTYFNNNGLGMIPIIDKDTFQGRPLTVEITCPDSDISVLSAKWVLKLVVLEESYDA